MKTRQMLKLILILLIAALAQAACAPTPTEVASAEPTATVAATAAAETKLLTNAEDGYSLLYPADDVADMPGWVVINPITSPGDMAGDAWLYIQVQDAAGKSAAQIVDEQVASLGEGFNITRVDAQVGGEPAIAVDGIPGQDSNRQVFIVHNGRLYNLTFAPWSPNAPEQARLEDLYTVVMDSFQFLP